MSYGVGFGSDLALLRLWCRPAAVALIKSPAWELPYTVNMALKSKKKKNKTKKQKNKTRVKLVIQPTGRIGASEHLINRPIVILRPWKQTAQLSLHQPQQLETSDQGQGPHGKRMSICGKELSTPSITIRPLLNKQ